MDSIRSYASANAAAGLGTFGAYISTLCEDFLTTRGVIAQLVESINMKVDSPVALPDGIDVAST